MALKQVETFEAERIIVLRFEGVIDGDDLQSGAGASIAFARKAGGRATVIADLTESAATYGDILAVLRAQTRTTGGSSVQLTMLLVMTAELAQAYWDNTQEQPFGGGSAQIFTRFEDALAAAREMRG